MLAIYSKLKCTITSRNTLWRAASGEPAEVLLFLKFCVGFYVQTRGPWEVLWQSWDRVLVLAQVLTVQPPPSLTHTHIPVVMWRNSQVSNIRVHAPVIHILIRDFFYKCFVLCNKVCTHRKSCRNSLFCPSLCYFMHQRCQSQTQNWNRCLQH